MMSRLGRGYHLLMEACGYAAALLFGIIAVLITLDVGLRNLGLGTLPWILEVSEYGLTFATFIGAPWLLYHGGHVRIEILLQAMPHRLATAMEILADVAGAGICLVFVYYGMAVVLDAWRIGALVIKTLVFPEWWILAPVPFCAALMTLGFLRRIALALAQSEP